MALQGTRLEEKKFCCLICLNLLKDPVTIPCGHSYCVSCIDRRWDEEDQRNIYSCPQCRQSFRTRPDLVRSTMFADLVEELRKLQAGPPDHCYAGPGDVPCDFCTGRKMKALKSCLQCLVSYCEQHLQPHYDSPAYEKHKLVKASANLQESICSRHDEAMKVFCRTDQRCICYLCSVDEHKGHDTVSAAAERTERQTGLGRSRQQVQQRIQDREKDVKVLQQEVEVINRSADKAVRDSEEILTELLRCVEKGISDVKKQIRSQQKAQVHLAGELQEKLEQEIAELKRKDAELQQLSLTEDHALFLHVYPSLSRLGECTDSDGVGVRSLRYFEEVTAAVSEVRVKLEDALGEAWQKISMTVTEVFFVPQPEPTTRAEFLEFSRELTLDPKTANLELLLSDRNRRATVTTGKLFCFGHPQMFSEWLQVLSRESLTGRCYWEVAWSGDGVSVAVAYKDIVRTGDKSGFGNNDKSWALSCFDSSYYFRHNHVRTSISGPRSSRVGVYLDHRAGILSFYSVSETVTLLHRVRTTFTQPLHAGLWVYWVGSSAEFCKLK